MIHIFAFQKQFIPICHGHIDIQDLFEIILFGSCIDRGMTLAWLVVMVVFVALVVFVTSDGASMRPGSTVCQCIIW